MNEPSERWMTWSASSLQANSTVPRTRSFSSELPGARHLQAHDVLAALRPRSARASSGVLGHPGAAVLELAACRARPPCARRPSPRRWRSRDRRARGAAARRRRPGSARRAATGSTGAYGPPTSGPSSQSRPSQRKPCRIGASAASTLRCWSVSSMRRTYLPPCRRAKSQLNSAVRTPPMCRKPVGLGANRVRGGGVTRSCSGLGRRAGRRRR